jgi:hypothetical protein
LLLLLLLLDGQTTFSIVSTLSTIQANVKQECFFVPGCFLVIIRGKTDSGSKKRIVPARQPC